MKIDFNLPATKSNADMEKITKSNTTSISKTDWTGGYQLDISGTVMDNAAYGGHGKTKEECMQEVGQDDVALQRNYMAVMSNSLSTEDFSELQKKGYRPGEMPVGEAVTVVDEIKVKLAEAGINIAGYTDTVDSDTVEAVTGNKGRAISIEAKLQEHDLPVTEENVEQSQKALDQAKKVTELSEGAVKYMVENDMEPTIENIYLAEHSAPKDGNQQGRGFYADDTSGYYAKKADTIDFDGLKDQIEKVIRDAGITVDEESVSNAQWLIEKGIPLTTDALTKLTDMKQITFPLTDDVVMDSVANALSEGKDALKGSLISAKRVLEETRLRMTTEANLKLLKSGYSIETAELTELVDNLKQTEKEYYETLFGGEQTEALDNKISLYKETTDKLADLKTMPAALLGKLSVTETFSLNEAYTEGAALKSSYEKAGQSYEALQTEVRPDLGDSIQKAFRNVDDILEDMELPATSDNQKAVRILGYNQMEINEESVEKVKEADQKVNALIQKMTPSMTLKLIREGINPLSEDVSSLKATIEKLQTSDLADSEKYSEFLWKLEKNDNITENERDAYIGIYRLFRQIEKTDGAAIGSLVNQNADLTLGNILSAGRSRKSSGMNYTVDDNFGGLNAINKEELSISDQIENGFSGTNYYTEASKEVFEKLDPSKLNQMNLSQNTTVEDLLEGMRGLPEDEKIAKAYQEEQAGLLRQEMQAENDVIQNLIDFDQPVTADNLTAAKELMNYRGSLFNKVKNQAKGDNENRLDEVVDNLYENMTDEEAAQDAYQKIVDTSAQVLNEVMNNPKIREVDVRGLQLLHKQLSLAGNLAKEENYEVPVEVNGETTSINLRIVHGEETGKVEATMYTDELGSIAAKFTVREDSIEGYIGCSREEGVTRMSETKDALAETLAQTGREVKDIAIIKSKSLKINEFSDGKSNGSKVDTKELYQIAKAFIEAVKDNEKEV